MVGLDDVKPDVVEWGLVVRDVAECVDVVLEKDVVDCDCDVAE